jgi:hypothetical protein
MSFEEVALDGVQLKFGLNTLGELLLILLYNRVVFVVFGE